MLGDIIKQVRTTANACIASGTFTEIQWDATDSQLESFSSSPKRVCAVQTEYTDPKQMSLGKKARYRQLGILQFVLYEPNGDGDGVQLTAADAIVALLRTNETTVVNNSSSVLRFSIKILDPSIANGAREGSSFVRIVRATLRVDFYPHVG